MISRNNSTTQNTDLGYHLWLINSKLNTLYTWRIKVDSLQVYKWTNTIDDQYYLILP